MKTSFYTTNREVEIPYEDIVKNNEVGIIYLDSNVVTYANDAFLELICKKSNSVLGLSIFNHISDQSAAKLEEALIAFKSGEITSFSDNLQMAVEGDEDVYFSLHLSVHTKSEDSITLIGASRNSTPRVKKMEELIASKSMFDSLYNNIVDGIMIYDYNQEKIIDCNSATLQIFGYENKEELLKLSRFEFVPKTSPVFPNIDFHEATKDHGLRVMNKESFKTPGAFVKKNGNHMVVHASVVPTLRNYGEAYIIFQDSTKRVLAKKAQKAAEKRYKDIFQNSHEGIIYTDINTKKRIICNDKALQLFGVSTFDELQKLTPSDFFLENNIDGLSPKEIYNNKINNVLVHGKAEASFWLKKQTGETIRAVVVMMKDDSDSKNPKVITFLRDITSLYNSEVEISEKNKELESYITANLQLENFAYFASHDLQTPLRGIISFTQLLQRSLGEKLSEKEKEYMGFIVGSTKNMRNLINDILSYSKVNTSDINFEKINLEELISELCQEIREEIKDKDAIVNFENIPAVITADAIKLKQLLQNLISNAVKFSKEDVQPVVTINCTSKEDHWLFAVQDNGIGIDPSYSDKIFLIFKRLHTKAEYEGTGIGLAMVKKIIEQHGGKVWLDSTLGEGTTFYFTIKKKDIPE